MGKLAVGCDLGDRRTQICILAGAGEIVAEALARTTPAGFRRYFSERPTARVVIGVGTHSPWVADLYVVRSESYAAQRSACVLLWIFRMFCRICTARYPSVTTTATAPTISPIAPRASQFMWAPHRCVSRSRPSASAAWTLIPERSGEIRSPPWADFGRVALQPATGRRSATTASQGSP